MKLSGTLLLSVMLGIQALPAAPPNSFIPENPLAFVENKGQVTDQQHRPRPDVLYSAEAGGLAFFFKQDGISYQLGKKEKAQYLPPTIHKTRPETRTGDLSLYRLDLHWIGAQTETITPSGQLPGLDHFYTSEYPDGLPGIRSFARLDYRHLYRNIHLSYYADQKGLLKYDLLVEAGADYRQIALEVNGATNISLLADGSVLLSTPLGDVVEEAPVVFQEGKKLEARWLIKQNVLSYEIDGYDPELPLLIDPVTRIWGTYYGWGNSTYRVDCFTDLDGNVVICGFAGYNLSGIASTGAYQATLAGSSDAYVAKFDPNGKRLWGTYYGGVGGEGLHCGTADVSGNIYVGGTADSLTPLSPGCHQPVFGGHMVDGFILKLSPGGIRLWATLYGEGSYESIRGLSADNAGNVFACGDIAAPNVPISSGTAIATPGSHQSAITASFSCFLVKFNSLGQRQWATFYGNPSYGSAETCAADPAGNVYLIGRPSYDTVDFISTPGAFQTSYGGGNDGFIAKFDPDGTRLWGTYYGGSLSEYIFSGGVDASGNVVIAGWTDITMNGTAIPGTPGVHQPNPVGSGAEGFATMFSPNGTRLWTTYFGGFDSDGLYGCDVDSSGNVSICGIALSTSNIASPGSHQAQHSGVYGADGYLARFNNAGGLLWATYYGGKADDEAWNCASDRFGNVFVSGETESGDTLVMATPGSHQQLFNGTSPFNSGGGSRAFLGKFTDCANTKPLPALTPTNVLAGPCGFSPTLSVLWQPTVIWYTSPSGGSPSGVGMIYCPGPLAGGVYEFYAQGLSNCTVPPARTGFSVTVGSCTGIGETEDSSGLTIYPNPADESVTIQTNEAGSLQVYNLTGVLVMEVELEAGTGNLSISELSPGVYILQIRQNKHTPRQKLVVH